MPGASPKKDEEPAPAKVAPPSPTETKRAIQSAREDIKAALAKKRNHDRALMNLETTLWQYETSYLNPTTEAGTASSSAAFGNIVRGYDQYLKAPNISNHMTFASDRNKRRSGIDASDVRNEDRLFSRSSDTYLTSLDLKERETAAQREPSSEEEEEDEAAGSSRKRQRR